MLDSARDLITQKTVGVKTLVSRKMSELVDESKKIRRNTLESVKKVVAVPLAIGSGSKITFTTQSEDTEQLKTPTENKLIRKHSSLNHKRRSSKRLGFREDE